MSNNNGNKDTIDLEETIDVPIDEIGELLDLINDIRDSMDIMASSKPKMDIDDLIDRMEDILIQYVEEGEGDESAHAGGPGDDEEGETITV